MSEKVLPQVRVATPDEVETVAEVSRRTFHDAFRDVVAPAEMTTYLTQAFSLPQMAAELADPANLFLLALLNDSPVGYAKLHFGPAHESVHLPAPVKLWRIYADIALHGHGIGAALMRATIDHTLARGGRSLWLTTNIHNDRAITFYQRWGFQIVGATTFPLGNEIHHDHVMACLLPSPA